MGIRTPSAASASSPDTATADTAPAGTAPAGTAPAGTAPAGTAAAGKPAAGTAADPTGGRAGRAKLAGRTGTTHQGTDTRREQMLRAAVEVLAERGFPVTRIADVAERAGVSAGLVIYYFGTKEALLTAALTYSDDLFYDDAARRLATIETATGQLTELVRLSCEPDGPDSLPGSWALWFDMWAQAVRRAEVNRDRAALDERWRSTIADIVRAGQASGEFAAVDPEEFALLLSSLLDGLSVQIALADATIRPSRAFELAMKLCASELGFMS